MRSELTPSLDAGEDLTAYILQDAVHNRLTPRVVDIAYSAFMVGRTGKNKDDGGPCDWFNDTKPMVMGQLTKIRKDLAAAQLADRSFCKNALTKKTLTDAELRQVAINAGLESSEISGEVFYALRCVAEEAVARHEQAQKHCKPKETDYTCAYRNACDATKTFYQRST